MPKHKLITFNTYSLTTVMTFSILTLLEKVTSDYNMKG